MTNKNSPPEQKIEAAIQQLNLGYNAEQDRLLLKVGLNDNTELALWLTNRMAKALWQLLNSEAHLPTANSIQVDLPPAQAVQQFKQEVQLVEALQKMDFSTEYQPRADVVNDGALLATSVQLMTNDSKLLTLEVLCLEGLTVRINLTPELMLALCNMLQLGAKEATWNITEFLPTSILPELGAQKVLH